MRIDVLLGEGHVAAADVAGRVVVVIDVLRAATTVATALANGARAWFRSSSGRGGRRVRTMRAQ